MVMPTSTAPAPSVWGRLRRLASWQTVGVGLLLALLAWLILVPVFMIIWGSFRDVPPGTAGHFTLAKYVQAYTEPMLYRVLGNSLTFAVGATLVALCLGTFLAWVAERTNAPLRWMIYGLVLFPVVVPGILSATIWMLILNPRIGLVNLASKAWFGLEGPLINGFSMPAMMWVQGVESMGLAFLMMAAALKAMDPSLEESAAASGGSLPYVLRTVTFPLLKPSLLAATILVFMRAFEAFEVPSVFGISADIPVFSTLVWLTTSRFPRDLNLAAAFSTLYMALSLVGLFLYYRALRQEGRFATITGKGFRPVRLDLGRWRIPVAAGTVLILFVTVLLPLLVILWTSLSRHYTIPSRQALAVLTTVNYDWVFSTRVISSSLSNNLIVGISSSLLAVLLAAVLSWVITRTKLPGRQWLDAIAFVPIALPGMVMAVALLWLYLSVPVPIYGTLWILIIAFFAKYTCYAMRSTHASFARVHRDLEDASYASGASWGRTFAQVIVPLIVPGLIAGFIYVLSLSFKVLSLPLLLSGPDTKMLPVAVWDLLDNGYFPRLAALGMVMFACLMALSLLSNAIGRRVGVQEK